MHELHDELQRHAPNTYSAAGASNARCCFVGSLTLCFTTLSFFSGFLLGDTPSWSRGREAAPPVEPSGANAAGAAAAAASVSVLAPDASSCAEGSGVEAASASAPSAASPPAVDDAASACAVASAASARCRPRVSCLLRGSRRQCCLRCRLLLLLLPQLALELLPPFEAKSALFLRPFGRKRCAGGRRIRARHACGKLSDARPLLTRQGCQALDRGVTVQVARATDASTQTPRKSAAQGTCALHATKNTLEKYSRSPFEFVFRAHEAVYLRESMYTRLSS